MKITGAEVVREIYAYVLLGNGTMDERIISALAKRYNHSKEMRIPIAPQRPTGLDAVVKALIQCIERSKVIRYVVVLDREHITSMNHVEKKLKEHGLEMKRVNVLCGDAIAVEIRRGSKEALLYAIILGFEKRIEENLSKLIELEYGEHIEPDKKVIRRWLKEHGLRDINLIEKATVDHLEEAFPGLSYTLKILSKDP
mgnify:CR=1 FL=1